MKKFFILSITSVFLFSLFLTFPVSKTFAMTGVIDPNNTGDKFAKFSLNQSIVNFKCDGCGVSVGDDRVTGYAWAENFGWINLNPSTSGVANDGLGVLSGYAWGDNAGWVNFAPTNGGVSINTTTGNFSGHAWSENYGWLDFDCAKAESCVNTDWRPPSTTNPGGGGGGSGGGTNTTYYMSCSDGIDNDGDGFRDYPEDLGCVSADSNSEILTACADLNAVNTFESIEQVNVHDASLCIYALLEGCMDPSAVNFNDKAEVTDGGCLYSGCMDPTASNYVVTANYDNGSCKYSDVKKVLPNDVLGCTNPGATNFNSNATKNDGSCVIPGAPVFGCMDSRADNFNPDATSDNKSCVFPPPTLPPVSEIKPSSPANSGSNLIGGIFNKTKVEDESLFKKVAVASFVGLAISIIPSGINILSRLATSIISLINLIPALLGLRRKKRPWGTVYDSVTKQPLDPVHVSLLNKSNKKEISTTITDLDGRYGFLVEPGKYLIKTRKGDYIFPSVKMAGKKKDVLYDNLYFGEEIEVKDNDLIVKNIPMDSINFNWNEFEKAKNKQLMKFFSKGELFLARLSAIGFATGLMFSLVALFMGVTMLSVVIISIYGLVIILRLFGVRPQDPGYVLEAKTGYPLSFGIIKIFSSALDRQVAHTIISKTGRYYGLIGNGKYYMVVSKKTGEDSYEDVYTTPAFEVRDGRINRRIRI